MSEPVCKCEHPKMFYSKRAGKEIFVSCGKCLPCRMARQARWVVRLQEEAKAHMYTMVILLEYNDLKIPQYDISDDGMFLVDNTPRLEEYYRKNPSLKSINLNDLVFDDDAEYNYVLDRLNTTCTALPHASVYDIQIFKKRLNTKIKREITGEYGSFRSAIVAEYGSTTFRPHYHGILFFDDDRILKRLPELVRDCWTDADGNSLGYSKVEPERGHFASYISKYITKPADLPQIYDYPGFKTFFLTSRHPPIGSLLHSAEDRYVFDSCYPQKVEFAREGNTFVPKVFPIGQSLESRLFPKCPLYGKTSRADRDILYRMMFDADGIIYESYQAFFNSLLRYALFKGSENTLFEWNDFEDRLILLKAEIDQGNLIWKNTCKARLVKELCGDFTTENSFHTLYSIGRRIKKQAYNFGYTYTGYVNNIYRYYDIQKPRYQVRRFYSQQEIKRIEDAGFNLRMFYPLTFYNSGDHPEESQDSLDFFRDLHDSYFNHNKSHRKNAYFESRKLKSYDYNLYLSIKNYYHAKECDEALEAIA